MPDFFNIGLSALNAASVQMATVSQNIANANNAGYTDESVVEGSALSQNMGYGFVGNGVDITQVARSYNKYLSDQMQSATASNSYSSTLSNQLSQVDNTMGVTTSGISPSLQTFFSSMQTLSQDPTSIPSRQNVISSAQSMVAEFQSMNNQLTQIQQGTNTQISSAVTNINSLANSIASLNQQIMSLSGGSQTDVPNDLLDQRDTAITQLNQLVQANYVQNSDGSYSVFIGNGQTLVQGSTAMPLGTQPDATNPENLDIVQQNGTVSTTLLPDDLLSGGSLGGLLNFRDTTLSQTQQALGNIAIDFTTSMNYQQQQGLDLNGNAGTPMFSDLTSYASDPQNAIANMQLIMSDPSGIAAASDMTAGAITQSASSNVVVNSVSATLPGSYGWTSPTTPPLAADHPSQGMTSIAVSATSSSNITATITGGPDPGTYNVVVDPTATNGYKLVTNATPPQDVGVAFSLSGEMQAGMSFTITPNTAATMGTGDDSNLVQMDNLQNATVVDDTRDGSTSGLQTFQNAYSTATSVVGNAANAAQTATTASAGTLQQTTLAVSNASGVNMDQEAAKLIQYQEAYQAASKIITAAQTLFQSILQI